MAIDLWCRIQACWLRMGKYTITECFNAVYGLPLNRIILIRWTSGSVRYTLDSHALGDHSSPLFRSLLARLATIKLFAGSH